MSTDLVSPRQFPWTPLKISCFGCEKKIFQKVFRMFMLWMGRVLKICLFCPPTQVDIKKILKCIAISPFLYFLRVGATTPLPSPLIASLEGPLNFNGIHLKNLSDNIFSILFVRRVIEKIGKIIQRKRH